MSECVIRMEMPSDCERCPMCGTASGGNGMYELWCMCGDIPANSQKRPEDCPILCQLPEGHGRLVDADAMDKCVYNDIPISVFGSVKKMASVRQIIEDATTIVPAERSET